MGLKPDGVLAFVILDIVIILIAARVVGAIAQKLKQPRVVGEIVAGVLLGPTLLGRTIFAWDHPWKYLQCPQALTTLPPPMRKPSITACFFPPQSRSVLGILGQIALILFMFLVGLELDFSLLKGKGKAITTVAVGAVAVPIALGFVIAPSLYNSKFVGAFGTATQPSKTSFTLMVGAMLAVTAFPVMARILQEKKLTQSAMGSVGIAAAALVTVLMFLAVLAAAGVATKQGPSSLGLKFLLTAVYIAALFLLVKPALAPLGRAYEARRTLTSGMFATIIIVLFASAYVAHKLGINVIVGGFLAGAVLPARAGLFRDMAARLSDFTAVILLPIFLAFSGLQTDFTTLGVAFLGGITLFLLAGIAGKWAGGAVFARLGGLSWAEGNVVGILMNCRGLLVLVVALIAFSQGVITPQMQVGGVLMALITTAMTGPLFDAFIRRIPGAEPEIPGSDVAAAEPVEAYRVLAALTDLDRAPVLAHAAFSLVGDRRPGEVVFARLFPLPQHELLSGINDELLEVTRSTRLMRMLASFAPAGIAVTPIAAASPSVAEDLIRIASDRHCQLLLIDREGTRPDIAQRLLEKAPYDVVTYSLPRAAAAATSGPVTVIDSRPGSETSVIAQHLAAGLGFPVDHVDNGGQAEIVSASRTSSALVVERDAAGPDAGALEESACPLYLVRPAGELVSAAGASSIDRARPSR